MSEAAKPESAFSKPQLLTFNELPAWRRDNQAILTGYRMETNSWLGCLWSVPRWHNETVNIWTHLVGAVIVSLVLSSVASPSSTWTRLLGVLDASIPDSVLPDFSLPTVTWSDRIFFAIFLLGAIVCFASSAAFHSSICHSKEVAKWMNRVDYFGILALGTVNYFPTFHYGFFCDPFWRNVYVSLMTISGSTGIYLVCAPTYASPAYRRMRTYTFFTLGFVALLPFGHALLQYGWSEAYRSLGLLWIAVETVAYIGGALLYAERCPECLAPGKFDYIGASHQIFHTCSLVAVAAHYAAICAGFQYWHVERAGVCA